MRPRSRAGPKPTQSRRRYILFTIRDAAWRFLLLRRGASGERFHMPVGVRQLHGTDGQRGGNEAANGRPARSLTGMQPPPVSVG